MPGVIRTRVGYAGGTSANPTYRKIGDHAETVDIDYDPEKVSYKKLLTMFWNNHDPSTKCSRQYMSAIFYHDEEQKELAFETKKFEENVRARPITTSILPAGKFTEAEDYHQKYMLQRHPMLCNSLNIDPGKELIESHVAARINGYIGGFGLMKHFKEECPKWGITDKMAEYIENQMASSIRN